MDYKFPCFRRKIHPLLDEELKKSIENLEKLINSLRPDGKNIKSVRNKSLRSIIKHLTHSLKFLSIRHTHTYVYMFSKMPEKKNKCKN